MASCLLVSPPDPSTYTSGFPTRPQYIYFWFPHQTPVHILLVSPPDRSTYTSGFPTRPSIYTSEFPTRPQYIYFSPVTIRRPAHILLIDFIAQILVTGTNHYAFLSMFLLIANNCGSNNLIHKYWYLWFPPCHLSACVCTVKWVLKLHTRPKKKNRENL